MIFGITLNVLGFLTLLLIISIGLLVIKKIILKIVAKYKINY
jgi:hypothetical protein